MAILSKNTLIGGKKPLLLDNTISSKSINLDDYTTEGHYVFNDLTTTTNFPSAITWTGTNASHLQVFSYDDSSVIQILMKYNTNYIFMRTSYLSGENTIWNSWQKIWNAGNDGDGSGLDADTIDSLQSTAFPRLYNKTVSDFNDATNVGFYCINGNINAPTTGSLLWGCIVFSTDISSGSTSSRYLFQIAVKDNTSDNTIYIRKKLGSGWTAWNTIAKTDDLRLQALIDKRVSLNSVELVKGDTKALRFLNPNTIDTPKSVTENEKWFGYVEVNAKYLNLTVGKQYIMFVHLNISDVGGTDPVSKTLVAQHKFGIDYQGLNATYNNLQEGDNYIAMVFTPEGNYYTNYGIYFDRTYNTSFTLTVKEVRVYAMDKSTETIIPENFTSALLDKPYYEKTDKDEYNLYGAVVQEVNLLKPYPILYNDKLYAAHWDGVYNGYLRIYSAGYFQGFEDRISSIEAKSNDVNNNVIAVNSSLITHKRDTKNPHKVTAGQTGAYTTEQTDKLLAQKADLNTFRSQSGDISPAVSYYSADTGSSLIGENSKCSSGIEYESNGDGTCYVKSKGSCTDSAIVLPIYSPDGDLVTTVGKDNNTLAFKGDTSIECVILSKSIKMVYAGSFEGCTNLETLMLTNCDTQFITKAISELKYLKKLYYNGTYESFKENGYALLFQQFGIAPKVFFGFSENLKPELEELIETVKNLKSRLEALEANTQTEASE